MAYSNSALYYRRPPFSLLCGVLIVKKSTSFIEFYREEGGEESKGGWTHLLQNHCKSKAAMEAEGKSVV